jgi:hypothetical protein
VSAGAGAATSAGRSTHEAAERPARRDVRETRSSHLGWAAAEVSGCTRDK